MEKGKARWLSRVREGSREVSAMTREVVGDTSLVPKGFEGHGKGLGFYSKWSGFTVGELEE